MIKLSNAEWKIMNRLWDQQPQTIIQLTKALQQDTGWTKHTVITYLKRLEEKAAVYFEQGEKAKQYYAKIVREEAVLEETNDFMKRVFRGNPGLMISTMIENTELSKEEIAELYELLGRK